MGHVACMKEMTNAYKILLGKPQGILQSAIPNHNTKTGLKQVMWLRTEPSCKFLWTWQTFGLHNSGVFHGQLSNYQPSTISQSVNNDGDNVILKTLFTIPLFYYTKLATHLRLLSTYVWNCFTGGTCWTPLSHSKSTCQQFPILFCLT
jgi:hypothetical protein